MKYRSNFMNIQEAFCFPRAFEERWWPALIIQVFDLFHHPVDPHNLIGVSQLPSPGPGHGENPWKGKVAPSQAAPAPPFP